MSDVCLLSNHAEVLLCMARSPETRLRHIADCVGITERATHRIVCELESAGYVTRHRLGRRNFYELHPDAPVDAATGTVKLGDFLAPMLEAA